MTPSGGAGRLGELEAARVALAGLAASPGVALGRAVVLSRRARPVVERVVSEAEIDLEWQRFEQAVSQVKAGLRADAALVEGGMSSADDAAVGRGILESYLWMAGDELLAREVRARIERDRRCAEWSVASARAALEARFDALPDPYLRERGRDVAFVCDRLLAALDDATGGPPSAQQPDTGPCVAVAHELSPADAAALGGGRVVALVTELGTPTSHTAILARALGIPAVVGVRDLVSSVHAGCDIVVDGHRGSVTIHPSADDTREVERRSHQRARAREARSNASPTGPIDAITTDGVTVVLRANVEFEREVVRANEVGARGVGLYRTEFLYVDRDTPPDEHEQTRVMERMVQALAPDTVTIRTFDLGGDKLPSRFPATRERNPMLGQRAVRLALARPDLFAPHLRAIVRAAAAGRVRVLVPMVTCLDEFRAVRALLDEARREVRAQGGAAPDRIELGVMIEVPGAALLADAFAREADFLALGTNDLVQYALAVDRTSALLAPLGSPLHPGVLRLVRQVSQAASAAGKPLSLCGAMASEPSHAALLVGLGLRELSMEPSAIPVVRDALVRTSAAEAEEAAARALASSTSAEVEEALAATWGDRFDDLER